MRRFLTLLLPWIVMSAMPRLLAGSAQESRVRTTGLQAGVEVVTDRWGIPHLRAASLDDLYFAWGWVHARDRLWQMVHARAAGDGRTHRWLGNVALRADGGAQLFRLRERAHAIWEREQKHPHVRAALERYAAGVNAYLALCRNGERPWPAELARLRERPRDWQPEDCIVVLLGFGITLDLDLPELAEMRQVSEHGEEWAAHRHRFEGTWIYDSIPDSAAQRLWPTQAPPPWSGPVAAATRDGSGASRLSRSGEQQAEAFLAAYPPRDADGADRASNAFVVGERRTANGKPILANDPHLGLTTPGPIHVLNISVAGVVSAVGGGTPGLPVIVLGRNATAAWGVTALSADVCDVYADTLSADGKRVRWIGEHGQAEWVPVETRGYAMSFRVFGVALPIPSFVQARRYTPHGPVLVWEPKLHRALSLRWTAFADSAITLDRLIGLESSATAREVTRRFSTLVTPCFNVVAADAAGGAEYRCVGLLPSRAFPVHGGVMPSRAPPLQGVLPADGQHEWAGLVPTDSMPSWSVPATGFVVNGNNRPIENYPYALPRFDFPHDRARRMAQRLRGDRSVTLADAASIQNDVVSLAAERNLRGLVRAADSLLATLPLRSRAALDTLRAWDFTARRSRVAPTLYRAWFGAYQRHTGTEGLPGLTLASVMGAAPEVLAGLGPGGKPESPSEAACAALAMALDTLAAKLGPDLATWRYERAHQARFRHALSGLDSRARWEPPLTPENGDNATPSVGASRLPWNLEVTHGPVFRHVVDLARPDVSWAVVTPWNSAAFTPAGDRDLRLRWARHAYIPLFLDASRVVNPLERLTLEP